MKGDIFIMKNLKRTAVLALSESMLLMAGGLRIKTRRGRGKAERVGNV